MAKVKEGMANGAEEDRLRKALATELGHVIAQVGIDRAASLHHKRNGPQRCGPFFRTIMVSGTCLTR